MSAVWCRECKEGKHQNCDGTAWDTDADKMVLCQCPYAVHGARPTQAPQIDTPPVPAYVGGTGVGAGRVVRGEAVDSPLTPYPSPQGPTSGFSGSDTSEARARREDADGTTLDRQRITVNHLDNARYNGITVKELRSLTGWHHGRASSVLSVLHKEGLAARLEQVRDRCHVYVLPAWVADRPTQPHGRSKPQPKGEPMSEEEAAVDVIARRMIVTFTEWCFDHDDGSLDDYPPEVRARMEVLLADINPTYETYRAAERTLTNGATEKESSDGQTQ